MYCEFEKPTFRENSSSQDTRETNQENVLDLAPGFVSEVDLTKVKVVLQALVYLLPDIRRQLVVGGVRLRADVLARLLLEDVRDSGG